MTHSILSAIEVKIVGDVLSVTPSIDGDLVIVKSIVEVVLLKECGVG